MDPSNDYCANKQQEWKPPQETTSLFRFEPENNLPNEQTNKQTNKQTHLISAIKKNGNISLGERGARAHEAVAFVSTITMVLSQKRTAVVR